jgi:hypothetical protein
MSTDTTLSPADLIRQKLEQAQWSAQHQEEQKYRELRVSRFLAHGRYDTYRRWQCRCEPCKEANAEYARAYRTKKRLEQYGTEQDRRFKSPEDPKSVTPRALKPITHGTNSGYVRGKCRCEPCRAAHAAEGRKFREREKQRKKFSGRTHGLKTTYTAGCRCTPCTEARREYDRQRYKGEEND